MGAIGRQRRHRRLGKGRSRLAPPAFNMVALMDIFTILVFFLLVNSGEMQDVPSTAAVSLPQSYANKGVEKSVTVRVTPDAVLLNDEKIASLEEFARSSQRLVAALEQAKPHAKQAGQGTESSHPPRHEVTVVGDKGTPYSVLKRVMRSCSAAGYQRISLAVIQTGRQG